MVLASLSSEWLHGLRRGFEGGIGSETDPALSNGIEAAQRQWRRAPGTGGG
jgi:hypothetical protein